MKKTATLIMAMFTLTLMKIEAQSVGIGTSNPDTSAILHLESGSKGFLLPRMKGSSRLGINNPASGLILYQSNSEVTPPSSPGIYYYEKIGSVGSWQRLAKASELNPGGTSSWTVIGNDQYSNVSGNVGIGTSNPNAPLHVIGSGIFKDGNITIDDEFGALYFKTDNINKAYMQMRSSNFDLKLGTIALNSTGKIIFETQSVPRMTMDPNGNLGIGSSVPTEKLHVAGNIFTTGRIDADGVLEAHGVSALGSFYVSGTSLMQGAVTGTSSASFSGNLNSNSSMTINNTSAELALRSGGDDKGFLQLSGDNLRLGTFSSNAGGKVVIRTGGADHISIDGGGNLVTDAHFRSNRGGEAIRLDGTNPNIGFYQNGTYYGYISQSGSTLSLGVNNGKLHLDGTQVAIGGLVTTATDYKLAVTGKIICEELRVELQDDWPDYVFAPDYKLKPLSEVKKQIEEHHHLSNIPSADQVAKEGIQVGEMQRKLLEKIEELTLYLIAQQEQIDELKKQVYEVENQKSKP